MTLLIDLLVAMKERVNKWEKKTNEKRKQKVKKKKATPDYS